MFHFFRKLKNKEKGRKNKEEKRKIKKKLKNNHTHNDHDHVSKIYIQKNRKHVFRQVYVHTYVKQLFIRINR